MKEIYSAPEMEVIVFRQLDVITTSGDVINPEQGWWGTNPQTLDDGAY